MTLIHHLSLKVTALIIIALFSQITFGLEQEEWLKAKDIAKKYLMVDTHVDVPYRLHKNWEDVTNATLSGNFDFQRAKAGGLDAPFMSIYVPASYEVTGNGKAFANTLIDQVEALVGRAPEKFALAYTTQDIYNNFKTGKISLPMGMENATPINGDIKNLKHFYDRGIRYITLAHSKANHISDSSYDSNRIWNGLSPFGKQVVKEMNNLGIMIDISHVSDKAFFDVIQLSQTPLIASHSSARHFIPGFERNLSDKMIQSLANNGGVIMINFGSTFLTEKANQYSKQLMTKKEALKNSYQVNNEHPALNTFSKTYLSEHPFPFATISDVANHIDHIVKLVGIEHVGIGSDYDGVGDSLPINLKDVSSYPNLIAELIRRGYSEADLEKLLGKNLMRVWTTVEKFAYSTP